MEALPLRFVAVDWSGAKSAAEQRRRIVVADWEGGRITITAGRTREETTAWLIEQAQRAPSMVVGLDFSFSFPEWFVRQCGAATIEGFWEFASENAERWLHRCEGPFWGRAAKRCPADHRGPLFRGYRQCERNETAGWQAKSTFQIGGAGAVGTASLRGMQTLIALRDAGFSIWPFHAPVLPCLVEIYPRSFTGPVVKNSNAARIEYLQKHLTATVTEAALQAARESEDAFDALCSVVGMVRQRAEFIQLQQASGPVTLLEGAIFPGKHIQVR
jgi:hypothetical protein